MKSIKRIKSQEQIHRDDFRLFLAPRMMTRQRRPLVLVLFDTVDRSHLLESNLSELFSAKEQKLGWHRSTVIKTFLSELQLSVASLLCVWVCVCVCVCVCQGRVSVFPRCASSVRCVGAAAARWRKLNVWPWIAWRTDPPPASLWLAAWQEAECAVRHALSSV